MLNLTKAAHPHRVDPAMSWQALSRLGTLHYSRESSTFLTSARSTDSFVVPSVLAHVTEMQPVSLRLTMASDTDLESMTEDTRIIQSTKPHPGNFPKMIPTEETIGTPHRPTCLQSSDQLLTEAIYNKTYARPAMPIRGQQETEPIRYFHDLNSRQSKALADTIGDHEIRICNGSRAYIAVEDDRSTAMYVHDTNYKFDFHEYELFFEFEQTINSTISVVPNKSPDGPSSNVITATELEYGKEITVDFGADQAEDRIFFLKMRTRKGSERWLKIIWQDDT